MFLHFLFSYYVKLNEIIKVVIFRVHVRIKNIQRTTATVTAYTLSCWYVPISRKIWLLYFTSMKYYLLCLEFFHNLLDLTKLHASGS
jgi:hypothetical protein